MSHFLDPIFIIKTVGLLGVIGIIFAESGLFFGFFLPGDSLLFTAGFLASQGYFSIAFLLFGCAFAAVLGDSVGYAFGKYAGPKIFTREDSFFFHKKHIEKTRDFYAKYGNKTIILARFVPAVRTFAPILAGVGGMKYNTFLAFNIAGGVVWSFGVILIGFFLGNTIPNIDHYMLPIILLIIVISSLPVAFEVIKERLKLKKKPDN